MSEKSVLRVADLLDWLVTAETASLTWDRGTRAQAASDCEAGAGEPHPPGPGGGLDLSEIQKIRTELGNYYSIDIELANLMPSEKKSLQLFVNPYKDCGFRLT